jgi:hypothetical protein
MAWGPNTALKMLYSYPYNSMYCPTSKSYYVKAKTWIKSNGTPKVGD